MQVYCVQLNIQWENKKANFARVEQLLAATPPASGSLVLLPEMFATGPSSAVLRPLGKALLPYSSSINTWQPAKWRTERDQTHFQPA